MEIETFKDLSKPADIHIKHFMNYNDNTSIVEDGKWNVLNSRLKIKDKFYSLNDQIDPINKNLKVTKVSE